MSTVISSLFLGPDGAIITNDDTPVDTQYGPGNPPPLPANFAYPTPLGNGQVPESPRSTPTIGAVIAGQIDPNLYTQGVPQTADLTAAKIDAGIASAAANIGNWFPSSTQVIIGVVAIFAAYFVVKKVL